MDEATQLLSLADAFTRQGRIPEAIQAYQRVLRLRPDHADSWYELGRLLKAEGRFEQALDAYQRALDCEMSAPEEAHLNRAVIFADHLRKDDEAAAELRAAISVNADYVPAWLNLGNLYEERGDRDRAAECYEKILPDGADAPFAAYRVEALARLLAVRPPAAIDDPMLARAQTAADGGQVTDMISRANLSYALGHAYDRLDAFDRAFSSYHAANRTVREAGPPYDRRRLEAEVSAMISACPPPAGRSQDAVRNRSLHELSLTPAPLFICGMFRSGSTLFEQVISSHSRIRAGGELNILHRVAAAARAGGSRGQANLTGAQALAQQYMQEIRRLFPDLAQGVAYVTDKRPDNFLKIGFIKQLFPDAKIIHTVRNPLDNCLSVYFQHIDQRYAGYASDLTDIAHYFGQYRRMMAHWKGLFGDDIIDVDYDRFVHEPEPVVKSVLSALGLDFEDAWRRFHERRNTVKTASYWQVRESLYSRSSGRWANYAAHIAPLRKALLDQGVIDLPDPD